MSLWAKKSLGLFLVLAGCAVCAATVPLETVTSKGAKIENGVVRQAVGNSAYCVLEFQLKEPVVFSPAGSLSVEYMATTAEPNPTVVVQLRFGKKVTWSSFPVTGEWQKRKVSFATVRFEREFGGKQPADGEMITGLKIYCRTAQKGRSALQLKNISFSSGVQDLTFQDTRPIEEVSRGAKPSCRHGNYGATRTDLGRRPLDRETVNITPAAFIWPVQNLAAGYVLEFARDKDFKKDLVRKDDLLYNGYCHNKVMAPGIWYWRVCFRMADGKHSPWSAVRTLEIAKDAIPVVMPSREELFSRIPAGHPRIFHRPEQAAELKKRFTGDLKGLYEELVQRCEYTMTRKVDMGEPGFHEPIRSPKGAAEWRKAYGQTQKEVLYMTELAFGWYMTGKPEYLEASRKYLADIVTWNPAGSTSLAHNDECGMPILHGLSRTYTYLYSVLTPEEKAAVLKVMKQRGAEAIRRLGTHILTMPFNSHSNRLFYFLAEAGLAFYGDIPEASEWLYLPMLYFYTNYPAWGDEDGGWHEGSAYFTSYMNSFFIWGDTMKNVLGIPPLAKPFFSRAGNYYLYTEPPESTGYGWADQCERFRPKSAGEIMRVMATQTGNPYWAWYADQVSKEAPALPAYLILARNSGPKIQPKAPTDLPTSTVFRKSGQTVLSNNLVSAADSVQILFKCGAQYGGSSHCYESPNTFILNAYGDRLLIRAGTRDAYGSNFHFNYMHETKSQNNILVDGKGMCKHTLETQGKLLQFKTAPELDTLVGEAGAWYQYPGVKSYTREIRFRKPSAILIIDRITADKPVQLDWLLHAKVPFAIPDQHNVSLQTEHAACTVDFLYPAGLKLSQTDQFDPPITAPRLRKTFIEHHLTASVPQKVAKACFITLIRPTRKGAPAPAKGVMTETEKAFEVTVPMEDGSVWKTSVDK